MNKLFGISVYLQDMSEIYIKEASRNGVTLVFTSLHIPEEDLSQAEKNLRKLIDYCHKYTLELVPDISPVTFEKLGLQLGDFESLRKLGIKSLRLDYGFDDFETILALQKDFKIVLNASTLDETFIESAQKFGINLNNLIGIHNFYPKNETGLSLKNVSEINEVFSKHNIPVISFVPGDRLKRFPLFEGLPTVENHRTMHPYIASIELIKTARCSGVMIGDSMVYNNTMQFISDYLFKDIITIPVHLTERYHYLYDENLKSRMDISEKIVRITTARQVGNLPENNGSRRRGDIIIQNDLAGRYSGELQLCKEKLPFSANGNNIGFIHPDFLDIMTFIDGKSTIKFIPI